MLNTIILRTKIFKLKSLYIHLEDRMIKLRLYYTLYIFLKKIVENPRT